MLQRLPANGHLVLAATACVAMLGCAASGQSGEPATPPASPPPSSPPAEPAPVAPTSFADADALLSALESSAATLRDFVSGELPMRSVACAGRLRRVAQGR